MSIAHINPTSLLSGLPIHAKTSSPSTRTVLPERDTTNTFSLPSPSKFPRVKNSASQSDSIPTGRFNRRDSVKQKSLQDFDIFKKGDGNSRPILDLILGFHFNNVKKIMNDIMYVNLV